VTESRTFWGAVKWAFALSLGRRASKTLFTFVLAALLGPYDFGLMAMALIYITLLWVLLEQGFMTAIVQREKLDPEHLDSAFWLNLVWCVILTGVGIATAPLWADLNGEPVLEPVVQVLSILVLIEGLALVQVSLLRRNLRFKELAIRSNIAAALGGTVGIVLALSGAGVWALVAQQAVIEGTALILIWAMSVWRPHLRFSRAHARELLPFSSGVFLSNLGGFLSQRADALLMGIFFGPVVVGIYRLADRFVEVLLELTVRPLGDVSLTVLSRAQADQGALRAALQRCLRGVVLFTIPSALVLVACSDELMRVIGPEWAIGADALKLLAIAGIAKAIAFFAGPVLFAVARSHLRAATQWGLAVLSAGAVFVVGTALVDSSLADQLLGMAASRVALLFVLVAPVNLWILCRVTGYRMSHFFRLLPVPLLAGIAALAATTILRELGLLGGLHPVPALFLSGGTATAVAAGVLVLFDVDVRGMVRRAGRRRRPSVPGEAAWQAPLPSD
jgi:O-antigen/teichoic acid export membrane protein